jgi:hypothetical protein
MLDAVGVVISQIDMAFRGQRIAASKIVSGVSPTRNSGWRPKRGASWGAWFVLAEITAAGLWTFVH